HGLREDTFYMIYENARQRALKPLTAGHLIATEKSGIREYVPRAQADRKLSSRASNPIEGNFAVRVNRNVRHRHVAGKSVDKRVRIDHCSGLGTASIVTVPAHSRCLLICFEKRF